MSYENEKKDEEEKKFGVPPSIPPPIATPPSVPPPIAVPPSVASTQPTSAIPSGPSQQEYDALARQVDEKGGTISQLQNQVNQLNSQLTSLQSSTADYQRQIKETNDQVSNLNNILIQRDEQIKQLNDENSQLQNQLQDAQQQNSALQSQVLSLQQQVAPLQQQVSKLQGELTYKDKRIEELKEPKAVMASTLAQQDISSQPPISPTTTTTPVPNIDISSGRRACPNCGASGFAIKEVEDKTKIVSYIPKPIYAKKKKCTKCGYEF